MRRVSQERTNAMICGLSSLISEFIQEFSAAKQYQNRYR
jgi:hypothetical protein